MRKSRLTPLGIIILLFILMLVLIFLSWMLFRKPTQIEKQQAPAQIEVPKPLDPQSPEQKEEPLPSHIETQETPALIPEPEPEPEVVPEILPPPLSPPDLPEAQPNVTDDSSDLTEDFLTLPEETPQPEEVTPLQLPKLLPTPETMSDEEKQAAIEAAAQNAAHVARTSGQSEAAAQDASAQAREQAQRIFYSTRTTDDIHDAPN